MTNIGTVEGTYRLKDEFSSILDKIAKKAVHDFGTMARNASASARAIVDLQKDMAKLAETPAMRADAVSSAKTLAAIRAENRALEENVAATRKGSRAVEELANEREVMNRLLAAGVTRESAYGKAIEEQIQAQQRYRRELDEATDALERQSRKATESAQRLQQIGGALTRAGVGLTAGVTAPILAIGAASIKVATDVVESENLFEVSFGEMADSARKWSEQTADALRLNEFELRKQAGTIYVMVESMGLGKSAALGMATGITELAGDMSSFFNLPTEEAFQKIRSGIVGETEPLRQLGILVDEATVKNVAYAAGIAKVGSELTQQQKVAARWLAIQQQTTKVQGDLARTLDSPANKLRALRTEVQLAAIDLGTALMPAYLELLGIAESSAETLADVAKAFGNLSDGGKRVVITLAAIAAAMGPLLLVSGQLLTTWATLALTAPKLAAGIRSAAVAAGPLSAIITVLAALGLAAHEAIDRWSRESERGMADIIAANNRAKESVRELREELAKGILTEATFTATVNRSAQIGIQIQALEEKLKALAEEREKSLEALREHDTRGKIRFIGEIDKDAAVAREQLSNLKSELVVVDNALAKAAKSGVKMQESLEGATGPPGGATQLSEALGKGLDKINATVETNRALLAALLDSQEAYDKLNALLDAGVPLVAALTGAYDDEAEALLKSKRALDEALASREEEAKLAERILDLKIKIARAQMDAAAQPIELTPEFPLPTDAMFAAMDDEEKIRAAQQAWQDAMAELAKTTESIMDQAWRNIQTEIADVADEVLFSWLHTGNEIADGFLDIIRTMLKQLLAAWIANVAARVAAERTGAAASSALNWGGSSGSGGGGWASILGGIGKLFGGGGATAGSQYAVVGDAASLDAAASTPNVAASGTALGALAIAGVVVAFAAWSHSQSAKRLAQRWFDVATVRDGWSAMFGSPEVLQVTTRIRDAVAQIFATIGGSLESLPDISVQVQATGERFRSYVSGALVGTFRTFEEAFAAAALEAVEQSDLTRVIPEIAEAIRGGSINSLEELSAVADVFSRINQVIDPVGQSIREFELEIERMGQTLADAGVAASALADYTAAGWQSIRDSITGATVSAAERFERDRTAFNREIEAERARQEAIIAQTEATVAATQAEVARIEATVASLGALASLNEQQLRFLATLQASLGTAQAALDAATAAAAGAQAALDALPDPIGPGEFHQGGGRGQRRSDLDRLGEVLDRLATERLPTAQRAMEEFAREWAGYEALAHGNAEALARLNEEMEAQRLILVQGLVEDVYGRIRDMERDPNASDFAEGLQSIADQAEQLRTDFLDLAEALDFGGRRIAIGLGRIANAEQAHLQALAGGEAQDLRMSALEFLGRSEEAERLRFELAKAEFQIRYAELQAAVRMYNLQIDSLEAIGALVGEIADLDFEGWQRLQNAGGIGGGGGGGNSAADAVADAIRQLREIQARSLSPLMQALRGVVDQFAHLRDVLGWTAEVQAAYAQEIRRVLTEQLEPIKRLQEELAFRSGSSMRSIDQFRLAQRQLTEAQAALAGGDLSQLDKIPDLARRVLELNPAAQASEGNRFIEAWVNSILDQAQKAAENVALAIDPGGPNDPFAWLRTDPTAGDQQTVAAIYHIGNQITAGQHDTTSATRQIPEALLQAIAKTPRPPKSAVESLADAVSRAREIEKVRLLKEISAKLNVRKPDSITLAGVA